MQTKIYIVIAIVVLSIAALIFASTASNAKAVVTVSQLIDQKIQGQKVQIGAQVVHDSEIQVVSEPVRQVIFWVRDREREEPRLKVVYDGVMPDTLRAGRDVILQGEYLVQTESTQVGGGEYFKAYQLLTQCPSKYEPPKPGDV